MIGVFAAAAFLRPIMSSSLQQHLRQAMRLTLAGRLDEATAVIQQAMSEAAAEGAAAPPASAASATEPPAVAAATPLRWSADAAPRVLDGVRFGAADASPAAREERAGPGIFTEAMYREGPRQGRYKLYVPPGHVGRLLPLVVMLHGCTQDADSFATGTAMNERAREQGFFVLYPEQSRQGNGARCWNWFKPAHRQRGSGEPALIAGMTQAVMQRHGIDTRRVYVAGLSAGGAMATIVAAAYPEVFAAVGVHSGPTGDAADTFAAAMIAAVPESPIAARRAAVAAAAAAAAEAAPVRFVPTIVFHGDHDAVVPPINGEHLITKALQALRGGDAASSEAPGPARQERTERGAAAGRRGYTRTVHADVDGASRAEHWLVHGAGHAWSGGQGLASYTDPYGPDASGEMLRFFAEHPLAPTP